MSHQASKRFGQNFLVDEQIIADIIRAIHPEPADNMVEIGPGPGRADASVAEETESSACGGDRPGHHRAAGERLPERQKLIIHAGDALKFDFATLHAPLRIVGNLPYNISSPLLFHVAAYAERIKDMHFMLQNEVVERMVAEPSTPEYGRLSVMLQYRFHMEKLLDVPPESFRPAPKVDSAIVRMIPAAGFEMGVRDEKLFAAIVRTAFGQRRKTLRNTLRGYLH